MTTRTKVVKIPVRIDEPDELIRTVKYRALDEVLNEARYLGNMAIRYYLAFRLKEIPSEVDESGRDVPIDTKVYRIVSSHKKFLASGCVATLARNFAGSRVRTDDKDAWAGKKSLPTYREKFVPFRHTGTSIAEICDNGSTQFIIEPSGFKSANWLPNELIDKVRRSEDISIDSEQRKLAFVSKFSWKDHGAVEVLRRICSGKYRLRGCSKII